MDDEEIYTQSLYRCAQLFADHNDQASIVIEALLQAVATHINLMSEDGVALIENFRNAHDILDNHEETCLESKVVKH